MAEVYTLTRQIVATETFEYPLDTLAAEIQREYDRQGLDCHVKSIWKLRGETQDTVVVETLAPSSSPVSEVIVMAIVTVILAIVGAYVFTIGLGFLERWFDYREKRLETLYHDIIVGLGHNSVEDMIKYKMENFPEEYAKHPYYCPYCGMEFSTEEARDAHVEQCPEAPPPAPTPPTPTPPTTWVPFAYMRYLLSVIGYRMTIFQIPWLRR